MEASEVNELHENQERAGENASLKPVSFSMSLLAVLLALTSVMGHRSHTEAVLMQARATDTWNIYQAKKIRQANTALTLEMLSVLQVKDTDGAKKLTDNYKTHEAKWDTDLKQEEDQALELQGDVAKEERRAARFDLGEALLQIGVIVTSVTLLTRQRAYWFLGLIFGGCGIVSAVLGFLIR